MYVQKIQITVKSEVDKDELIEDFGLLMQFYRSSGQTQGKIESQFIKADKITCFPFTVEQNSLDSKYNNFYVNKQIEKIEDLCKSKFEFKTVGKTYDSYKSPCTCKKSSFHILITNYVTIQPPLTCGKCNDYIPLYRLPNYYDYGYMPILSWETNYNSCDSLQMNCEVGEKWALNQMQKPNSQLSKQGLEICNKLEKLTSVPTFYYLHNYSKEKTADNCPKCGNNWVLKQRIHDFYDYKCDKCRLISTVSFNT
jgi:predicted  nucleic acid-binding Zn ribbon protein